MYGHAPTPIKTASRSATDGVAMAHYFFIMQSGYLSVIRILAKKNECEVWLITWTCSVPSSLGHAWVMHSDVSGLDIAIQ